MQQNNNKNESTATRSGDSFQGTRWRTLTSFDCLLEQAVLPESLVGCLYDSKNETTKLE